jgi:hypothetical protein
MIGFMKTTFIITPKVNVKYNGMCICEPTPNVLCVAPHSSNVSPMLPIVPKNPMFHPISLAQRPTLLANIGPGHFEILYLCPKFGNLYLGSVQNLETRICYAMG